MRDTSVLRARLHAALAGLPLLALGAACGGPPPQPTQATPAAEAAPSAPAKAPTEVASADDEAAEGPADEAPSSPYPNRWGRDPYDPEAEEEEGCVNGDWCGTPAQAAPFASEGAGEEMGCPLRLVHKAESGVKPTDKAYAGFSFDPMMQGRLRPMATREARAAKKTDDLCCYHWFNYCSGRPLLDGDAPPRAGELGAARVAALAGDGGAWIAGAGALEPGALPAALRAHLADAWLADARMEHASIAAFARATLELLALGAPPELVAGAQRAGLDEVEHARLCFGLAARYGGEALGPGPLAALAPRDLDLAGLAAVTFVEGCVGETIAALVATRAARSCRDPAVRAALERIAEDETRHAELAWATVAFAVERGGEAAREALRAAVAALREAQGEGDTAADAAGSELDAALLAAHGRLGAAALAEARDDGWREIIAPTLAMLLG